MFFIPGEGEEEGRGQRYSKRFSELPRANSINQNVFLAFRGRGNGSPAKLPTVSYKEEITIQYRVFHTIEKEEIVLSLIYEASITLNTKIIQRHYKNTKL